MEPGGGEADERYAQWYVWARRTLGAESRTCLAAAQAAVDVLHAGGDARAAERAARAEAASSISITLTRIPERRRQYAERYYQAVVSPATAGPAVLEPTAPVAVPAAVPAGFGRRLASAAIDTLVLVLVLLAVFGVLFLVLVVDISVTNRDPVDADFDRMAVALLIAQVVLAWLYTAVLHSTPLQATVGKLAVGLRVTDRWGRRVSFLRATARYVSFPLIYLTLGIGFLVILVPGSRQGLHDAAAGTLVVRARRGGVPPPPAELATMPPTQGPPAAVLPGPLPLQYGGARGWSPKLEAAFQQVRVGDERLVAGAIVYVGIRPWLLSLLTAEWIVQLVLPRGCLAVTDRRLLLFHVDAFRSAIDRLDRADDLREVRVRTFSRGLLRPRLVLSAAGRRDLQVTFTAESRRWADTIVAAVRPW